MQTNKNSFRNYSENLITWECTRVLCNFQVSPLSVNNLRDRFKDFKTSSLGETQWYMNFWTKVPLLLGFYLMCVLCGVKISWCTKAKADLGTKLGWYDKGIASLALSSSTIKISFINWEPGCYYKKENLS